jgi:sulfonate transport system substrate-binding protein
MPDQDYPSRQNWQTLGDTMKKPIFHCLLALALTACGGDGNPGPNDNLPLDPPLILKPSPDMEVFSHVDTFEMAPVVLAADSVYPGNLTVRDGGMADLFNNNRALVATNADTVALRYSVDNPNLRIVFTVCESYYRIVAKRSAGINQLSDLAGKTVQVIPQTSAAYFLHRMLATVGLTEDDIQLSSGFSTSEIPPWTRNTNIHALSAWEPEPQRSLYSLGEDAIVFRDRNVYREMVNVNTTAENLADPEKRAAIVAFVRALIVAADQVTRQPETVWPLMEEVMGFDQQTIADAWHIHEYKGTLAPDLLDVMVDEEIWLADVQGRSPRTREELAPLIDASILQEALRDP